MKYNRFEELPVWQLSADLAARIFSWSSAPVFRGKGDLANQIQRATLSISNNIAEIGLISNLKFQISNQLPNLFRGLILEFKCPTIAML